MDALTTILSLSRVRRCATIGAGNPAPHGATMTDQPVELPSGPIDPNNPPPPPPTKPKGSAREEAQESVSTDQSEESTTSSPANETSDE